MSLYLLRTGRTLPRAVQVFHLNAFPSPTAASPTQRLRSRWPSLSAAHTFFISSYSIKWFLGLSDPRIQSQYPGQCPYIATTVTATHTYEPGHILMPPLAWHHFYCRHYHHHPGTVTQHLLSTACWSQPFTWQRIAFSSWEIVHNVVSLPSLQIDSQRHVWHIRCTWIVCLYPYIVGEVLT